jgi:hypothetical protein
MDGGDVNAHRILPKSEGSGSSGVTSIERHKQVQKLSWKNKLNLGSVRQWPS